MILRISLIISLFFSINNIESFWSCCTKQITEEQKKEIFQAINRDRFFNNWGQQQLRQALEQPAPLSKEKIDIVRSELQKKKFLTISDIESFADIMNHELLKKFDTSNINDNFSALFALIRCNNDACSKHLYNSLKIQNKINAHIIENNMTFIQNSIKKNGGSTLKQAVYNLFFSTDLRQLQ